MLEAEELAAVAASWAANLAAVKPAPPPTPAASTATATRPATRERPLALVEVVVGPPSGWPYGYDGGG